MKTSFMESNELLANPGMGWQTFHRFADDDPSLAGLPSSSAYFRFYWREIEPEEGRIDFAMLDELLKHAHRAGQQLAFRVMCIGSGEESDVPAWLRSKGCRGYDFTFEGGRHWAPDWEDPLFQEAHFRLIRELGRRFNGHSDLDMIDIGTVGLWGEWHMSGTKRIDNGEAVPMPAAKTRRAVIDAWKKAFSKHPTVMLIGDEEGMVHATRDGSGWRADCLGDMGGFSKTWNHMESFYMQQIEKTGAEDAWKTGPVAFESCWDMRKWKTEGWDIRFIFDYALKCHAGYLNNKSAPLPEGTRGEVERLLRRIGYRLVPREIERPDGIRAGESLPLRIRFVNAGVAPPYQDHRLAVRLSGHGGDHVFALSTSIRGWLPGEKVVSETVKAAATAELRPGQYSLSLGIVRPGETRPSVRLAVKERKSDGWVPTGSIEIAAK